METLEARFKAGEFLIPVKYWMTDSRIFFDFPFNRKLKEEVKMMEGAKYLGFDKTSPYKNPDGTPRRIWSVANSQRNNFQIRYLRKENPYQRYDQELPIVHQPDRWNLGFQKSFTHFKHQDEGIQHVLVRRQCIIAAEMGLGKSLIAGTAMEQSSVKDWWYVAPKLGLDAVKRDFRIWNVKVDPQWMTYENVVKVVREHTLDNRLFMPPGGIIFDESSKLKSPQSQRSQAAKMVADALREEYGESGFVVLMTGTPAPKSPVDWYMQCEIACPGFLKEGDHYKFKNTLGVIVQKGDEASGGVYPQLVTWRNNEKLCNVCGQLQENPIHDMEKEFFTVDGQVHEFVPSVNEVARLARRLKGLVAVYLKKDCLDIPQKVYRVIEIKPKPSLLRAAQTIAKTSRTTIEGLTRLRELSDGFQYKDVPKGKKKCERCQGTKEAIEYEEIPGTCPNCADGVERLGPYGEKIRECPNHKPERKSFQVECPNCDEQGNQDVLVREVTEIPCEKYKVYEDLLDEYDDIGRIVSFGGFTSTIDRMIKSAHKMGWHTIRLDQGNVLIQNPDGSMIQEPDYLGLFQDKLDEYPKVAYIATPGSGGMAATLTRSPVAIYISNDFNGLNRMQSEDRIHRPGMDLNLGATIIDIFHLPSDQKVLENLQQKKDLQSMSLGDFTSELLNAKVREE